jgi:threonine/homoserine/homoserine lactone efflux protein
VNGGDFMDFWHGFAVITVAHLLAAASPGPDFAYVTRQSLVHGRKAGLLASAGIALGLSIHIVYSAAGLAAVIAHSAHWMTAIKLAGGCYLLYLGITGLRSGARAAPAGMPARDMPASPLCQIAGSFLCNVFNPKAPIYCFALFTVVLIRRCRCRSGGHGACRCNGPGFRWSRCCSPRDTGSTADSAPP